MSKSVHRRLSKMPASLRRQAIMFGVGEFGAGAGRSATALAALRAELATLRQRHELPAAWVRQTLNNL